VRIPVKWAGIVFIVVGAAVPFVAPEHDFWTFYCAGGIAFMGLLLIALGQIVKRLRR